MRRRDGLLAVVALWGALGAWAALFIWPVYAGVCWLVGLFLLTLYAALFVWPGQDGC